MITERSFSTEIHSNRFDTKHGGQDQQISLPDVLRVSGIVDALQNCHSHLASGEETKIERVQI